MTALLRPVVGNDVIDLGDPAIARHHERAPFVARVCSWDERERATTAQGLWALFAAKEAAYKALVKIGLAPGFAHRELEVAPDLRSVSWRAHRLELSVSREGERVHAVAWSETGPLPLARVARAQGEPGRDARSLLCALLASALRCPESDLAVVRDPVAGAWDGFGPPRVERRGSLVAVDVSLSHDGRFVAAAARPSR